MSIHEKIGADVEPLVSHLECMECGRKQQMKKGEFGVNLQYGWPKCCGYTMRLFSKNEVQNGA